MTLNEYLHQRQIEKQPVGTVYLDESEYQILSTLPRLNLQLILLKNFNYTYVYKTGKYDSDILWTADEYGNPKHLSVFAIKKDK